MPEEAKVDQLRDEVAELRKQRDEERKITASQARELEDDASARRLQREKESLKAEINYEQYARELLDKAGKPKEETADPTGPTVSTRRSPFLPQAADETNTEGD